MLSKTKHEDFENFPPGKDDEEVGRNTSGGDASEKNESEDDFIGEMPKDDDLGRPRLKKQAEQRRLKNKGTDVKENLKSGEVKK